MIVARFQNCVPLCVYELWKLSDWVRGVLSCTPPSQFMSQVRAFTDQAVWSGSAASVVWSWAALAYWPRQLYRLHHPVLWNIHSVHLGVWGEKASAGNGNMSTVIHVTKTPRLSPPCPWWACVLVRRVVFLCVCVWLQFCLMLRLKPCFYTNLTLCRAVYLSFSSLAFPRKEHRETISILVIKKKWMMKIIFKKYEFYLRLS